MFEVRIHGRGGQGVVTAAEPLSFAALPRTPSSSDRSASWPSASTSESASSSSSSPVGCGNPVIEVEDGVVAVGPDMMTGHAGIFAGGDMVPAERTVTVGIRHGKQAACHIDAWLRGKTFAKPQRPPLATFESLEARRCMSCGNCFGCDNCFSVCPDNAVLKLGPGGAYEYEIDLDFCKGCGLCVAECPCGALEMEPEIH